MFEKDLVSMPWIGLLLFLLLLHYKLLQTYGNCVNALDRATPISTYGMSKMFNYVDICVSMPWIGLLLFLPKWQYYL